MQTAHAALTAKESQLFAAIVDGMDQRGCGWLHELAEPSRSVSAVLGSLVKKGLVDSSRDDNGAPGACYWVSLTDAGEALAAPAAPAAPSPILPGESAAPAPLAPLFPAPSLPVWQAQPQQQPQQAPVVASRRVKLPASISQFAKDWNFNPRTLLSINPKTEKSAAAGDPQTYILHLSPASTSGQNLCPGAGNCAKICLHFAGNPVYMAGKGAARIRRSQAFSANPQAFLELLALAIIDKRSAQTPSERMAVRLNGTSDIRWESIPFLVTFELSQYIARKYSYCAEPRLYSSILEFFMHNFPTSIQFYDYTKVFHNWEECERLNYHLTASYDGADNAPNLKLCRTALLRGLNVAAAFNLKRGQSLPQEINADRFNLPSKHTWAGVLPVVDGDLSDFRPGDPQRMGIIIGLRFKLPHGAPWSDTEKEAFCLS
jgi:DNA-binding MarR family transcriptional regulator